jgi:hypothetical protein
MGKRNVGIETISEVAALFGVTIAETGTTGGGHQFVRVEFGGQSRKIFFPSTPSDHRGNLNLRGQARRVISELMSCVH